MIFCHKGTKPLKINKLSNMASVTYLTSQKELIRKDFIGCEVKIKVLRTQRAQALIPSLNTIVTA